MVNKNITLHTTSKDISNIIDILSLNEIPFEIYEYDRNINKYEDDVILFGLPPYQGYNRKYITYALYIPIKFKDKVISLFGFKDTNKNVFHFNIPKLNKETYIFNGKQTPKYPLYIVSYGRFKHCFYTVQNLEDMKLNYYLCIQNKQEQDYLDMLNDNNFKFCLGILLSENTTQGGTKQRNLCIKHALDNNFKKCWILDDNIRGWYYINENISHKITNGFAFKTLEDFMENIKEPVAIMSHSYLFDIRKNQLIPPFSVNHKNYSSLLLDLDLLIKHKIKFRLKYNEDVDLTLQALTNGLYTVGTNFIVADKSPTKTCKGGNTETVYAGDKFMEKFNGLYDKWKNTPIGQFIELVYKHTDGRPHHWVNYNQIIKYLGLKSDITPIRKGTKQKTFNLYKISVE